MDYLSKTLGTTKRAAMVAALAATFAAPAAWAQQNLENEEMLLEDQPELLAEDPGKMVSGVFGFDWNSHFISYGFDVWGAGTSWGLSTLNPYAELSFALPADFSVTFGTWWDVNDNAVSGIGGDLQEVDVYLGLGWSYDRFSAGLTYQEWYYGGGVERILDVTVGFDDSDLLIDGFAFSPYIVFHNRVGDRGLGLKTGTVFVLGVEPAFTVLDTGNITVDLAIPVAIGLATDGYHGGQGGLAYVTIGAQASMPLSFIIPEGYGDWALSAGVNYYHTPSNVTTNADEDFITGNVGISVAF